MFQTPGRASVRFAGVTGKHVTQSPSGSFKSTMATLTTPDACKAHYDLTVDVFGQESVHAMSSGVAYAETLARVRRFCPLAAVLLGGRLWQFDRICRRVTLMVRWH